MSSEVERKNALAQRAAIEGFERKLLEFAERIDTIENNLGTLYNLVTELQRVHGLAIATARGRGATSGDHD